MQFIARGSKAWRKKQLPLDWGEFLFPIMLRTAAQFRSSIKDNLAQAALKTERIDAPGIRGERRFLIRANGRDATKIKEGTLSEGFDHLRRWVVGQAEVRKGAK